MKTARGIAIVIVFASVVWVSQMLAFPRLTGTLVWERLRAVECTSDQAALARAAAKDSSQRVRLTAIEHLSDHGALARIATYAEAIEVCHAAIDRISDQDVLVRVAEGQSGYGPARKWAADRALARLDRTTLARVAIDTTLPWSDLRSPVINSLADQDVLVQVAMAAPDKLAREAALDRLNPVVRWQVITDADSSREVRRAAAERLTDQAQLASIAINDDDRDVRIVAARKLTDQSALATVAINDEERDVRLAAVEELTEQAALAKVATKDDDRDVRLAAVQRLSDQVALADVAIQGDYRTGWAAVQKLTDHVLLVNVATDAVSHRSRRYALQRLSPQGVVLASEQAVDATEQSFLAGLLQLVSAADVIPFSHRGRILDELLPAVRVYSRPSWSNLFGALDTIMIEWSEKGAVYGAPGPGGIARTGERIVFAAKFRDSSKKLTATWTTRFPSEASWSGFDEAEIRPAEAFVPWLAEADVIETLTDQFLLAEVAANAKSMVARLAAFKKSTDLQAVGLAAAADSASLVGLLAVGGTEDQDRLYEVVTEENPWFVRLAAVTRLTDQAALAKIVRNHDEPIVRLAAIEKLADQMVLVEVAEEDKEWLVQEKAIRTLVDPRAVAQLAINVSRSSYNSVGFEAVERLTDLGDHSMLVNVAAEAGNRLVRYAACERLTHTGLAMAAEHAGDEERSGFLLTLASFVEAAHAIPAEHRGRILAELMPAVGIYARAEWTRLFGTLSMIRFSWADKWRAYIGGPPIDGERIDITVTFTGGMIREGAIVARWETAFPAATQKGQTWESAGIVPSDLFLPWLATNGVVEKLTDRALLAVVAANAEDADIRRIAAKRLEN